MARSLHARALALALTLGGCTTVIDADVRQLLDRQDFPVSMDPTPVDCDSVGFLAVRDTGFYPFGFIPAVPMSLQHAVEELVRQARGLGGDGVSQVEVVYEAPAPFLSFTSLFVLDWFQSVTVTGSAWRRRSATTRW